MSCILFSKVSYETLTSKSEIARNILAAFNHSNHTGPDFICWSDWLFNLNVAAYCYRYDQPVNSEDVLGATADDEPDYEFAEIKDWEDPAEMWQLFKRILYQCSEFGEDHPMRKRVDTLATITEQFAAQMASPAYKAKLRQQEADRQATHQKEVERLTIELRAKYPNAKPAGKTSSGVRAAANMRAELKAAFPGAKISVTSDHNSINVNWTDGPAETDVDAIANRYKSGDFNGMDDSFDYDDSAFSKAWSIVCGSVRFVFTRREYTQDSMQSAVDLMVATHSSFSDAPPTVNVYSSGGSAGLSTRDQDQSRMVYELLSATDLRF